MALINLNRTQLFKKLTFLLTTWSSVVIFQAFKRTFPVYYFPELVLNDCHA